MSSCAVTKKVVEQESVNLDGQGYTGSLQCHCLKRIQPALTGVDQMVLPSALSEFRHLSQALLQASQGMVGTNRTGPDGYLLAGRPEKTNDLCAVDAGSTVGTGFADMEYSKHGLHFPVGSQGTYRLQGSN